MKSKHQIETAEIETGIEVGDPPRETTKVAPQPKAGRKAKAVRDEDGALVEAPPAVEEEVVFDLSLRPRSLDDFVGQERLKKILGMSIEAARQRGEVLDHVLFSGPPGLGKTSLAHIIARELGVRVCSLSSFESGRDEPGYYEATMRKNLETLKRMLGPAGLH